MQSGLGQGHGQGHGQGPSSHGDYVMGCMGWKWLLWSGHAINTLLDNQISLIFMCLDSDSENVKFSHVLKLNEILKLKLKISSNFKSF